MSEPHDNATSDADKLPPLDDVEPVTDPIALALGSMSAESMALPDPVLGSDEDDAPLDFGADDSAEPPPFFAGDDTPAAEASDAAGSAMTTVEAPAAGNGHAPEQGNGVVEARGRSRRVWREMRYHAFTQEKPVVE